MPKKSLGQHFLIDKNIAQKIVNSLTFKDYNQVLEIGPGMGILTELLMNMKDHQIRYIEIDKASVEYLIGKFPAIQKNIMAGNILKTEFTRLFDSPFAIIGNLPYNISSQIFFRILEYRNMVREAVCMVQREVAARMVSPPGSKEYGILSVLLQTFFHMELLFHVSPHVFNPPPRVNSSVIRLRRNERLLLDCDESLFYKVVKTSFNQRRKTLRNSLKSILPNPGSAADLMHLRPEQLGVEEFIRLTSVIEDILNLQNKSDL